MVLLPRKILECVPTVEGLVPMLEVEKALRGFEHGLKMADDCFRTMAKRAAFS